MSQTFCKDEAHTVPESTFLLSLPDPQMALPKPEALQQDSVWNHPELRVHCDWMCALEVEAMTSPSCALLAAWLAGSDGCRQGATCHRGPRATRSAHCPPSVLSASRGTAGEPALERTEWGGQTMDVGTGRGCELGAHSRWENHPRLNSHQGTSPAPGQHGRGWAALWGEVEAGSLEGRVRVRRPVCPTEVSGVPGHRTTRGACRHGALRVAPAGAPNARKQERVKQRLAAQRATKRDGQASHTLRPTRQR